MINLVLRNIWRFASLVLIQGLIINHIDLGNLINPYLYVLFILMIPYETPNWLLLILGFTMGIAMDSFSNTLGMHTSACVFMAFCRPFVLKLLEPRDGYEFGMHPVVQDMGIRWYMMYASIMIFIHHLWFFYIEVFSLTNFGLTLARVFLSTFVTLTLVIISNYLFYKPARTV